MTDRERTLVHAAANALYWLKQLEDDLRGHLSGERQAISDLEAALRPYKKKGIKYTEY